LVLPLVLWFAQDYSKPLDDRGIILRLSFLGKHTIDLERVLTDSDLNLSKFLERGGKYPRPK
jgi:hypothetical protein